MFRVFQRILFVLDFGYFWLFFDHARRPGTANTFPCNGLYPFDSIGLRAPAAGHS